MGKNLTCLLHFQLPKWCAHVSCFTKRNRPIGTEQGDLLQLDLCPPTKWLRMHCISRT
jgi:hypothetical protein